ncbi:MAG: glucosaminidase domain-containing protein [Treponema sp.]|nr:glucosaminidase domain-containing protein [Treponema sp.]
MNRKISAVLSPLILLAIVSCAHPGKAVPAAGTPAASGIPAERTVPREDTLPPPPQRAIPEDILGRGRTDAEALARFLERSNNEADRNFVMELAALYVEEAAAEGVNHDMAFAQMCLETGFLRYGGLVNAGMNNFCGLGAIGPGQPGEVFPNPRTGVRAHIQHLKGYATDLPLNGELVDPRYRWVRKGSSPKIRGLAGTWAADKNYGDKINRILERMYYGD